MHTKSKAEIGTLADDVLWGGDAIAEYLGRTPTQIYYLASRRLIPTKKVGNKTLVASKRGLRAYFQMQEGGDDAR